MPHAQYHLYARLLNLPFSKMNDVLRFWALGSPVVYVVLIEYHKWFKTQTMWNSLSQSLLRVPSFFFF